MYLTPNRRPAKCLDSGKGVRTSPAGPASNITESAATALYKVPTVTEYAQCIKCISFTRFTKRSISVQALFVMRFRRHQVKQEQQTAPCHIQPSCNGEAQLAIGKGDVGFRHLGDTTCVYVYVHVCCMYDYARVRVLLETNQSASTTSGASSPSSRGGGAWSCHQAMFRTGK